MATLADLEAIIGPPTVTPPMVDWLALERISGLSFPPDYKAFASRYGMLEIEAFMSVDHVGLPADMATMLDECQQALELLKEVIESLGFIYLKDDFDGEVEAEPYSFYPEPGGLFPWGATQNGDSLLWLTNVDPNRWTIVVTDGGAWWHFDGSLIDFLVGILSRTVRCPILPKSFPSRLTVVQYSSLDQLPGL